MPRPKAFDLEKAQQRAMRLFWRKGYAATSIEDLVETLGLSRSSIYGAFDDKRTLFIGALRRYSEGVIGRMGKALNEADSPVAAIQQVFDDLIAQVGTENGAMGCFMVNSIAELVPYDDEVTAMAKAYNEAIQGLLIDALTRAEVRGELKSGRTAAELAAYLFNAIQGLRILIKSGATREQLEAIRAITLGSL